MNHHVLWASISYVNRGGDGPPTSLNWIRLCLSRSGRHDLHLAMNIRGAGLKPIPYNFSIRKQNRNSSIGHLISFLDTMEDDMDRVFILSLRVRTDHLQRIIIPLTHAPKLKRLLLAPEIAFFRDIDANMFSGLERLEHCVPSMHRTTLASLFNQCPSLRHFYLKTLYSPRHCHLGQSAQPAIHAPRLHTLHLESVLPARAFDAPELKRLVSMLDRGMGRVQCWWETNHFSVRTADHHEDVAMGHFPQLRQLTVGAEHNVLDYLEPSIRLIRAQPDVSHITLDGHHGAGTLLAGAFQRTSPQCPIVPLPANVGDGREACAASENGRESEIQEVQVPIALRSLIIMCNDDVFCEGTSTDVLRNMMLASDVLRIVILLRPRSMQFAMPNGFYFYAPLFTEFPGRCSFGTLRSSTSPFLDGDAVRVRTTLL